MTTRIASWQMQEGRTALPPRLHRLNDAVTSPLFAFLSLGLVLLLLGELQWLALLTYVATAWLFYRAGADRAAARQATPEVDDRTQRSLQKQLLALANASHDLRQPMHAMALYLGELSSLDLPERARRAVGDARLCADDLNDMFRSVLDMAQLDSQAARPQPRPFCVAALLDRVERTFKPLADAEGVDLRVLSRAQWAHSDPAMVERVIMNFTSNALRHARGNRVLVTCRARGDTLRLAVHDNGAGIAPAQQQAIFEAFYRLDTGAHQRHTGFGLGLSIVSRLTHMLDVPLVLRSAPGHGSMFAIDLPRASTNPVPTEEEAS